jgi:hypothetical protein
MLNKGPFLFSNGQEEEKEFLRKRRSRERRLINIEREELARRQEEVKYRVQMKMFLFRIFTKITNVVFLLSLFLKRQNLVSNKQRDHLY